MQNSETENRTDLELNFFCKELICMGQRSFVDHPLPFRSLLMKSYKNPHLIYTNSPANQGRIDLYTYRAGSDEAAMTE